MTYLPYYDFTREGEVIREDVIPPLVDFAKEEILTGTAFWALETYARKKPLTFAGRVIGHGLPFLGAAFVAYDIYQLADYIYSEY